jgi:pimeloyl-ACP methyl ester carboxylesterase
VINRVIVTLIAVAAARGAPAQGAEAVAIRGRMQYVHLYGPPAGAPVVVSSGDGGWLHLAPHLAEVLAVNGYRVVGFDAKAYLASFTSGASTLQPDDVPADYRVLIDLASGGAGSKPILIGVSEGAALSVLAAANPQVNSAIEGVITFGLPDVNELGWRWKDSLIYLTHGVPNEPTFSVASIVARVSPAPLAAIYSTRDEFVSRAEIDAIMSGARDPKQLWTVDAADHRFSDKLDECDRRLVDALAWVRAHARR